MKKFSPHLLCIILLSFSTRIYACHGMPLVGYSYTIGATGVTVKANSDPSTCGCGPYWLQVEVSCSPVFTGTMQSCLTNTLMNWNNPGTSYTSFPFYQALLNVPNYTMLMGWPDNCVLETYNPVFIPFSNFCPGTVMYFRSREVIGGSGPGLGAWTSTASFTVPGAIITPTCSPSLTHSPPTSPGSPACAGSGFMLTINNLTCTAPCGTTSAAPSCAPSPTVFFKWRSNPGTTVTPTITSLPQLWVPFLTTTTTFSVWAIDSCNAPGGCQRMSLCAPASTAWPLMTTIYINNIVATGGFTASPNQCLTGNNFNFTTANMPGYTYNWNFGDGGTGGGPNVSHTYATAGSFVVTQTVTAPGACGPAITTQTVIVYPMPTVVAGNTGPVCASQPLNLTSGGAVNYSWTGPGGFTSLLQNPNIPNSSTSNTGVYVVTGTDANGCTATASTNVIVKPGPYLNVITNGPVCSGQALSVSVTGSGNYGWSGPGGYTSSAASNTLTNANVGMSGVYTVTASTAGCVSSATILLTVDPTPTVTIVNSGSVCVGSNVTIYATGGGSYNWSGPGGFASNQATVNIINATASDAGIYSVTVTSTAGCVATATTLVIVNPKPVCASVVNTPICSGEELNFVTNNNGAGTYMWNGPNGYQSSQKNPKIVGAGSNLSGSFTLTVTSDKNCTAQIFVPVVVNPIPDITISVSNAKGCAPLCGVNFDANSTSTNIKSYDWNLGNGVSSTSKNITNTCFDYKGNYAPSITVVDNNNCRNTATTSVIVFTKPVADYNYSPSPISINNPVVNFKDASFGDQIKEWSWTFYPTSLNDPSSLENPTVTFRDTGVYKVFLVVTSVNGCKDTAAKAIFVYEDFMFYVPNAFTPNGDGQNDEFKPVITNVTNYSMIIYDRWGKEVFATKDPAKGWDGVAKSRLSNSNNMKQEVYIWRIEYTINKSKTEVQSGHVTLIK